MMKLKKPAIGMILLAFTSLILIAGSPFQSASNLVENNGYFYIENIGQKVYAADDDGGENDKEWLQEQGLGDYYPDELCEYFHGEFISPLDNPEDVECKIKKSNDRTNYESALCYFHADENPEIRDDKNKN